MANNTPLTSTDNRITAIIIVLNEEQMIANCIETLSWCHQIIVLDTGSTDRTREISERLGAKVHKAKGSTFAQWRNEGAQYAKTEWILYIDADERVTPPLAKSIQSRILRTDFDAYSIRRNNIHFGRWMQYGGWQNDVLLRLMKKDHLRQWIGDVHEHAEIAGRLGVIEEPLVHLTHRNLFDGLRKSAEWTDIEAHLLLEARHPKVGPLRLIKIVIFDFFHRVVIKLAWKDGAEGMVEAMVQTMNRFLVYARLWELQQKPPLEKRYEQIEKEIQRQWHET